MSKMKHLLRKLHLGGGGDHHNHDRLANPSTTSTNPPPLPQPASSSSSSSSSSSVPSSVGSSSSSSRAAEAAETRENGSAAGLAVMAAGGSDNGDFSIFEEEYQVQLALAISASDPDGLEDADAVQMKAATQMSLSCAPAAVAAAAIGGGGDENRMEYLSVQYWTYNVVNYDEKLMDGFYDVYGIMSSHQLQGQMPSLVDLQATSVSDNIEYEVVVVNRTRDPALQQLERKALSIALQSREAQVGPIASGLVQKIANLVVDNMGGPVADAEDILRRWTIKSHELRTLLKTIVLPLGLLEVGLSRHRALLFKVLADRINLPCRLVKGSYYTGTDEGAVNFIKIDYDGEYIIDLMGAPGTLIPAEFPSSHLQDSGLNLFTSNTIEEKVKDLCSALDNIKVRGNASYNSSVPEIFDPRSEEKPGDYPSPEVDSLMGGDQGKRFEHESGEVHPLGGSQADEQGGRASASTGWQTKVDGVSKCVVSAEGNPEFAQKLPAVLLESGAPPPQDFFSDINPLQDSAEQDSGKSVCTVGEMEKDGKLYQDKSARIQPSFMPSTEAESFNCAVYKAKKLNLSEEMTRKPSEDANVNKNPIGTQFHSRFPTTNEGLASVDIRVNDISYADSKAEGPSLVLDAAVVSEDASKNESPMPFGGDLGQDQCVGALEAPKCSQEVAGRSVADLIGTKDNDALKDYQESASESLAKCKGPANKGMLMLSGATNKRSHPIMDDVAEWEIPWEDLQIGERIGLGSYGEVYRADWNGTEVAVKKFLNQDLSGDALEQFRYEVKIMLRLRHPNVVLFMGAVTRPPNLSILTEFLPRGSLFRLLHRPNIQIDEKRRLKMALDVARGMNYLHSSHPTIVHRDLKSPNLLVDRNWVVKVCDFGLSRLKHHTFLSSKSTAGTPEWMAPEVLRNEPSNEKCDVYSFGVILWELATLSMPWSGMNPMQVVGAVGFQDRRLDIPKEVDPMVAQIISDCWQSEPNQRPSFAQLMSPLRQLQRLAVATS